MLSMPEAIKMWSTDPWGLQDPSGSLQGLLYFHNNSKMSFAFLIVGIATLMVQKQQ